MRSLLSPIVRRTLVSKVRLCDQLKHEKNELIVWWYGGIKKNYKAESVPLVVVFFRRIDKDGNLGNFERRSIALTFLGLLRIGSIWKDGKCVAEAKMPTEHKQFDVDFTQGAWKFVSPSQAAKQGMGNIINQNDYLLPFAHDKNCLIDFPIENGKNLLIPCAEFFVRNYGRSEEVPRVLATYGWEKVNKHFYVPFDQPVMANAWPVKLKSRMYNGDVVFLAHMKYDQFTVAAAKRINSQIETSFLNKEPFAFIQVGPWFESKAQVLVSGRWINEGKTFLALRILGGSDPQEAPIQRDRENSNQIDGAASSEQGTSTDGRPPRSFKKPSEIVDLTDEQEPDHGAASVEVEEPDYVVLGKPRDVFDVKRNKIANRPGKPRDGGDPMKFSSGDPHGSGKGVGFASIHAPAVMESEGMLRDMWKAMHHVKKEYPSLITSVEWFTFEAGFNSGDEPKLVGLQPFKEDEKVETAIRNWQYLNVAEGTPRGILIAKIIAEGKEIYIAEIERRPRTKKNSAGDVVDTEESYKGFVFVLDEPDQFELWLGKFLADIRNVKGVVQKLIARCPGKAAAFKHSTAKGDEVPCKAAVLNALEKMDIKI